MYSTVATRLYVKQANGTAYSQAVSMEGANAVTFDATAFNVALTDATDFTIQAQGSNDLQNWADLTTIANEKISIASPGYHTATTTFIDDVGYAYVRLSYSTGSATSTDYIIVNAGIGVFSA